ncbi:MAG: hypothetical protein K6A82_07655 [Prevotella sp.]|nr:hypothetical protein [Prevotella sp.]
MTFKDMVNDFVSVPLDVIASGTHTDEGKIKWGGVFMVAAFCCWALALLALGCKFVNMPFERGNLIADLMWYVTSTMFLFLFSAATCLNRWMGPRWLRCTEVVIFCCLGLFTVSGACKCAADLISDETEVYRGGFRFTKRCMSVYWAESSGAIFDLFENSDTHPVNQHQREDLSTAKRIYVEYWRRSGHIRRLRVLERLPHGEKRQDCADR